MTAPELKRKARITCLALGLLTLLIYAPSFDHSFVHFDDTRILLDHPELYNQDRFADSLKAILFEAYPREEPLLLRDLSWAIDSRLFGFGNATAYHSVTIVMHALVVMLLFGFLLRTTKRYPFALLASACYLILAVHVEPVVWIMGRKDVLSTLFAFLALLSYQRVLEPTGPNARVRAYLFSLIFLVCGLFSKINLVVLPGVLFLYAALYPYLSGQRDASAPLPSFGTLIRHGLGVLPHLLLSVLTFAWYKAILDNFGLLNRGYTATALEHAQNLLTINPLVFFEYVKKLLVAQDLALLYGWPALDSSFRGVHLMQSGLIILFALGLGVYLLRRRKDYLFYYASFFVLMVPYVNLTYIGIWMADRYLYASSFCFAAIFADLLLASRSAARPLLRILAVVLGLIFALTNLFQQATYQRAWTHAESLWRHNLAHPDAPIFVYNSLAQYYFTQGRDATDLGERGYQLKKAETVIDSALDIFWEDHSGQPPQKLFRIFFIKGLVLQVKGAPLEDQLAALRTSAQLSPTFDAVRWHLAMFYYDEALGAETPDKQKQSARKSLGYYEDYMRTTYRGITTRTKIDRELADYAKDFPFLEADVERIK